QAEDGIRDKLVTGVQTCALPICDSLNLQEFTALLNSTEQLVQIKGQWVQIDQEKLHHVLSHWKTIEQQVKRNGLSFAESLRLLRSEERRVGKECNIKEGTDKLKE